MGSRWSVYFFGWCRLLLHHSGGVCVRGGVSMAGYFKKLMARHQDHPRKKQKKVKNTECGAHFVHRSPIDQ